MSNLQYFSNCKDLAEAKKLWRELCFKHHPDKGGNVELMQEINKQYAEFCSQSNQNYTKQDFEEDFYDLSNLGVFSPEDIKKMKEWFVTNFPEQHPIYSYLTILMAIVPSGFSDIFNGYMNKDKQTTNQGIKKAINSIISKL